MSPVETSAPSVRANEAPTRSEDPKRLDPHSFARPDEVRIEHLGLHIEVSFASHRLHAVATVRVRRQHPDAPLVLDTRGLAIESVRVARLGGDHASELRLAEWEPEAPWIAADWRLEAAEGALGRPLVIALPDAMDVVRIVYRTSPDASGLQWLEARQTADGAEPFLYSQSQAIHARSWIPCQDTPGVRQTFDALVESDRPLQALMAAEGPEPRESGRSAFWMPQPIPSYLLALAVGRLEHRVLGPRTAVWAEPSVVAAAAHEFADVESMLQAGEDLYGPYRWGRYDLLVLPPAFPFGGMENPRLTFATPTILAGDRSLVSLVAHELAHSWSGNLVTNATWSDLWLNEGFTVYFERRIVEALYGRERAEMESTLGFQELEQVLRELAPGDQRLKLALEGRDPDDAMTPVAYEKGALFLRMLEETYGRAALDAFLRRWFDEHAFSSVSTDAFLAYLDVHLLDSVPPGPGNSRPDVDAWVFSAGLGPDAPRPQTDAFEGVEQALVRFAHGRPAAEIPAATWVPQQWLRFLRGLPASTSVAQLTDLDRAWRLSQRENAEILAQWLEVAVQHGYRASDPVLERFLLRVGRRKFLMPLYKVLLTSGRAEDARRIYAQARSGYHAIARRSLDELLARDPAETAGEDRTH